MGETLAAAASAGRHRDALMALDQALGGVDLDGRADLAVIFIGVRHAEAAEDIAARLRTALGKPHVLGATAGAVIAGERELEDPSAVAVWAARLPGVTITPLHYAPPVDAVGGAAEGPAEWHDPPEDADVVIAVADPFGFPADALLSWLGRSQPGVPVAGGLASGGTRPGENRLLLDEAVHREGAVAMALTGVRVRTLVSQGCRPVGASYIVTRAEGNVVYELGGAPAAERLREAYAEASPEDQTLLRTGLQVGLAIDEYRDDHGHGDFLIRGVIGADEETGALAVGDVVTVGQTAQFQVRDAASADADLRALLERYAGAGPAPAAALLFTCNGRGSRLFGRADHDAGLVREHLGPVPLAGFFAAGELGRVGGEGSGDRSHLHGFTASLVGLDLAE